jgi:LemA protein
MPIWLIVVLVVVVLLVILCVSLYNGIVTKRNRCENAWQNIDTQLQRRNDLIPNLVETVKGYAAHEKEVLSEVTKMRSAVQSAGSPAEKMAASNQLSGALTHLFAVAESYPQLQANENFVELQRQLQDTENKISYARQSYNDCVMTYNTAIETFPGSMVAGFGGFQRMQGFEVTDASVREVPQAKF